MNWLQNLVTDIKKSKGFGVTGIRGQGSRAYTDFDIETLTNEGYRKNSIASACIQMVATSAPEAPLKVYRVADDHLQEDPNHWLAKLMDRPNSHMSTFELWEWVHTFMNTGGSSYWELVRERDNPQGEVLEIYPLRPDRMTIIPDEKNYIAGYVYTVNGQQITYEPWEILHIKFPDPLNEYYGLAPLKRVARELSIDNEATDFTKAFLENDAVPGGILTTDQTMSDVEAEREAARFWKKFRKGNRGKPAVLGKGAKYQQMALSFRDMEFESLRSFTETRICSAFGVDPVLLPSWVGIKHGGKYSNYAEARKHLWEETIIPTLRRIESKVSTLLPEGYIAKFDLSVVTALAENEDERFTRYINAYNQGLLMLNEARTGIGYKRVPKGDKLKFEPGATPKQGLEKQPDNSQLNNQDTRNNRNRTKPVPGDGNPRGRNNVKFDKQLVLNFLPKDISSLNIYEFEEKLINLNWDDDSQGELISIIDQAISEKWVMPKLKDEIKQQFNQWSKES
jgi:HK97 family phage portal protein